MRACAYVLRCVRACMSHQDHLQLLGAARGFDPELEDSVGAGGSLIHVGALDGFVLVGERHELLDVGAA